MDKAFVGWRSRHNHRTADAQKMDEREMLRRAQVGWEYLEVERLKNLANVVTKDALPALESSFAYAQMLPPRMSSGFIAFYQALGRESGRCSINSGLVPNPKLQTPNC